MSTRQLRIVSLLPSATEIICALGLEDALVGVTHECDYPSGVATKPHVTASRIDHVRMSSAAIDHAVRSQLDGHGSIYDLDQERLEALHPDLIVTQELCEVCAVSYKTVAAAARSFTTDTTILSLEPNTIAEIFANIETVGRYTDRVAAAATVVRQLKARCQRLLAITEQATRQPRTLMLEWLEPPFTPGHWVPEQVALAGGDGTFGQAGGRSTTTTASAIQAYAPEVIVLIPCGYTMGDTLAALDRALLPSGWHDLPAVQNGEVWAVDASAFFSRPGPRVVDGAEILARILHPELCGSPQPDQAVRVPRELMHAADGA